MPKISRFHKNLIRVRNTWIPRQAKRKVDGKPKGPNATEERYMREILGNSKDAIYQPPPIIVTKTARREYTADFLTVLENGKKTYHEIKGSYHLPTHERARLAWEIAAESNPDATFVWAELTRRGWEIEEWIDGGNVIVVKYAEEPIGSFHEVKADWRRHKPRKGSCR